MANFSDARCALGGVCPNDPLIFTCELHDVVLLMLTLPTGYIEVASLGDTADDVSLPNGFTAHSLVVEEIDVTSRNIALILNATLLNGGQIRCGDSVNIVAMAGCPLAGKPSVYVYHASFITAKHFEYF